MASDDKKITVWILEVGEEDSSHSFCRVCSTYDRALKELEALTRWGNHKLKTWKKTKEIYDFRHDFVNQMRRTYTEDRVRRSYSMKLWAIIFEHDVLE